MGTVDNMHWGNTYQLIGLISSVESTSLNQEERDRDFCEGEESQTHSERSRQGSDFDPLACIYSNGSSHHDVTTCLADRNVSSRRACFANLQSAHLVR